MLVLFIWLFLAGSPGVAQPAIGTIQSRVYNPASQEYVRNAEVRREAFTVSREREGNAKAIMEQRRSLDITTSVASDIFGAVTDNSVGEFIKYAYRRFNGSLGMVWIDDRPESGGGLAGRSSAGTAGGFAGEQRVKFPG